MAKGITFYAGSAVIIWNYKLEYIISSSYKKVYSTVGHILSISLCSEAEDFSFSSLHLHYQLIITIPQGYIQSPTPASRFSIIE